MNKKTIVEQLREQLDSYCQIDKLYFLNSFKMGQIQNIQFVSQLNILLNEIKQYSVSFRCHEILKEHFQDIYLDFV